MGVTNGELVTFDIIKKKEKRGEIGEGKEEEKLEEGGREIIPTSIVIGASLRVTVAIARHGPVLGQIPRIRLHLPAAFAGRESPNSCILCALDLTHCDEINHIR